MKTEWKKAYKGPFEILEAARLANELREKSSESGSGIKKVRVQPTEGTVTGWDVWIEMEICQICGGSGEVTTMEAVDPREPHLMAPVGTKPCPDCTKSREDSE